MTDRTHELRVFEVIKETADAVTLVFDVPAEVASRFDYKPGQFLTVCIPSERTGSVARCYSLSSSPHQDSRPAVTVKRVTDGFASNWICDNIAVDSTVTVLEPSGAFTPRSFDDDVMLCAAGSGITPILSIAKSLLHTGTGKVTLLYANRDRDAVIFARQIGDLAEQFPQRFAVTHWLESERGLPQSAAVADLIEPHVGGDVFLCGPTGFADQVRAALTRLQVPAERLRTENYKSLETNPFLTATAQASVPAPVGDGGARVRVELDGESHVFDWPKDTPLLDVLLAAGLDPPHVCRESACGTCVCSVRSGRTRMRMNESLIEEELSRGLTLACQTLPESAEVDIAFDQ